MLRIFYSVHLSSIFSLLKALKGWTLFILKGLHYAWKNWATVFLSVNRGSFSKIICKNVVCVSAARTFVVLFWLKIKNSHVNLGSKQRSYDSNWSNFVSRKMLAQMAYTHVHICNMWFRQSWRTFYERKFRRPIQIFNHKTVAFVQIHRQEQAGRLLAMVQRGCSVEMAVTEAALYKSGIANRKRLTRLILRCLR